MAEKPTEDAQGAAAAAADDQQPTENSAPGKQIRTIVLTGYGGIRNVKILNKPEITPKEGEVLIRVKATGLNFTDLVIRQGAFDNAPKTPFVMGLECSGEVEALGENVDRFEIGDRVVAVSDYNSWAEQVAVPAQFVYKMPTGMNFHDGAAFFMNYITAYILLFAMGNLKSGQSLLIHSAGGGVGIAVSQLAKTLTDVKLFGTASQAKHEALKKNYDHVFDHVVDYCQEIRKVAPEGVDLVLDCLCGEDTNKGISILKPLGRYILFGSQNVVTGETKSFFSFAKSWWQVDKVSPIKLYDDNRSIAGFHLRQLLFKQGRHEYVRNIVNILFKMYNEGKIRPEVDSAWAYEDVGDAMQKMHDRKNIGKIVLDPYLEPAPPKSPKPSENAADGLPAAAENAEQKKDGEAA